MVKTGACSTSQLTCFNFDVAQAYWQAAKVFHNCQQGTTLHINATGDLQKRKEYWIFADCVVPSFHFKIALCVE